MCKEEESGYNTDRRNIWSYPRMYRLKLVFKYLCQMLILLLLYDSAVPLPMMTVMMLILMIFCWKVEKHNTFRGVTVCVCGGGVRERER